MRVGDILVVYNSLSIPMEMQPNIVFPRSEYASKASSRYNSNTNGQAAENKKL